MEKVWPSVPPQFQQSLLTKDQKKCGNLYLPNYNRGDYPKAEKSVVICSSPIPTGLIIRRPKKVWSSFLPQF